MDKLQTTVNILSIDNIEKFVACYGKKAYETSSDVPEHLYPHMWRHLRAHASIQEWHAAFIKMLYDSGMQK